MLRALAILLALSAPACAGDYLAIITAAAAATAPQPAPQPTPSSKCANCGGTGKLGDGTVSVPCPVCGGDGVLSSPASVGEASPPPTSGNWTLTAPRTAARGYWERRKVCHGAWCELKNVWVAHAGYPVRTHGRWWSGCRDWRHLTQGEHRGRFNHAWLQSLTWAELQSLHSDAHEGKTNWRYARRPQ